MVSIPHLQVKSRWDLVFSLIPGKHGLLFGDDDLLLSHEIVKGVHEAPVEVPLPGDGMVVDVCVLLVLLLSLQPAVTGRRCEAKRRVSTQSSQKCKNGELILPPHKYVTWFLASEDIIVFQDNLICIPDDHPELKPAVRWDEKACVSEGQANS